MFDEQREGFARVEGTKSREISPEQELHRLEQELQQLDQENFGLVEVLLAQVAQLRDPLVEKLKNQKDSPLSPEEKAVVLAQKKVLEPLWTRLSGLRKELVAIENFEAEFVQKIPREQERNDFIKYYESLPTKELKKKYRKKLESDLCQPNEVSRTTHTRGTIFEMSKIYLVIDQGLETLDPQASEVLAQAEMEKHTYKAYEGEDPKYSEPASADRPIKIDMDVPIVRETPDGKKLPFVYETKSFPRKMFGQEVGSRNQLLKYQKAIELGLVAGSSMEIQGRLDPKFLSWALGSAIDDPGPIPDVEIIYNVPLPSGAEYRFPLKMARRDSGNLKFITDTTKYSERDKSVIAGIQNALMNKDKRVITSLLVDTNIDFASASDALKPFLHDVGSIEDIAVYTEYEQRRLEGMYQKAEAAKRTIINEKNENCAYGEEVTEEYVTHVVRRYQEFLRENPETAKIKKSYLVEGDLSSDQYEKTVERIIQNIMQKISGVRNFETERKDSFEEMLLRKKREEMGWVGLPEGIALDVEHVMLDAILEINKRKEQRGRSYENFEERFLSIDQLQQVFADSNFDRRYQEIVVLDPLAEDEKKHQRLKDATDQKVAQSEVKMLQDNLLRADARVLEMKGQYEALVALENPSREQQREKSVLQRRLDGLKKVEKVKGEIEKVKAQKVQEVQQAERSEKGRLAKMFDEQVQVLNEKMVDFYKDIVGGEKIWQSFTKRVIEKIDRNIVKFIYAVNSEGNIRVDEEKFGGAVTGRAAHSELGGGTNVYGAGELAFEKVAPGKWKLIEINNGSGHYRPDVKTLLYVKNVLETHGVVTSDAVLRDSLLRGGISIRDLSLTS